MSDRIRAHEAEPGDEKTDLFCGPAHDPGGRRAIPLPPGVTGTAIWGGPKDCYRYRVAYRNTRWEPFGRTLAIIMMNPSTASHLWFDPTLRKCWKFAEQRCFSTMIIGNVFAYRATDQKRLAQVDDPIGPQNDAILLGIADEADIVVLGYGTPQIPRLRERGPQVARMLRDAGVAPHVFELSKFGVPKHPLYLKEPMTPFLWQEAPND